MQLNLPPAVRVGIYLVTAVGSLVVAYLSNTKVLGPNEVELWVQLSALVNGLAAVNVNLNKETK